MYKIVVRSVSVVVSSNLYLIIVASVLVYSKRQKVFKEAIYSLYVIGSYKHLCLYWFDLLSFANKTKKYCTAKYLNILSSRCQISTGNQRTDQSFDISQKVDEDTQGVRECPTKPPKILGHANYVKCIFFLV
jgi:hypothetical protein